MPSAIVVTVSVGYILASAPSDFMTKLNVASNVGYIACCIMFLATGLLLPTRAPASDIELIRPHGMFSAAGILVFSPAAHSYYPTIMQRMEEPHLFPICLRR